MTQRTFNIIRACKGTLYPEIESKIDRVRTYMSEECGCPIEAYTDVEMENIVVNAMYDYIDTCDRPSVFLRQVRECMVKDLTLTERICIAFSLTRVRNSEGEYINGFKVDFFK